MKIGGCVVLYNPDVEVISNIQSYIDFLEVLVVVDNSSEKNEISKNISDLEKVHYIDMIGNRGIAFALNTGLDYLYERGFECALTMDQDSRFPDDEIEKINEFLDKYFFDYSIISLGYKKMRKLDNSPSEVIDVPFWITSGNFVKLEDYRLVGGFNNDLFIDSVDHEFCWKLKNNGKKIGIMRGMYLKHSIGSPNGKITLFGTSYSISSNHSPIRYYYRYRNIIYLHNIDKKFFKETYIRELYLNIIRMLLFDNNKKQKISMIRKGIKDGKDGKLGKYCE